MYSLTVRVYDFNLIITRADMCPDSALSRLLSTACLRLKRTVFSAHCFSRARLPSVRDLCIDGLAQLHIPLHGRSLGYKKQLMLTARFILIQGVYCMEVKYTNDRLKA